MKKLFCFCFFLTLLSYSNAQTVRMVGDKDSVKLTEEYEDFSTVFGEINVNYLSASKKYINDLFFQISSESVSSDTEFSFTHELFVLKDGTVQLLQFSLTGGGVQMTKEQEIAIKKKLTKYIKQHKFSLKAKKNWHEFGLVSVPQLAKKRFYRDYIRPNPMPTASEDTKLGIIQRLSNFCTETWQNEGTRNPMELKFIGLVNVCLFTLDDDNALFSKLKKVCPNESKDSLMGQIYDYMFVNCPIFKAKYGFFEPNPDYEKFLPNHCDCIEKEAKMISSAPDYNVYDANDSCKNRVFRSDDFVKYVTAKRDSLIAYGEKNNMNSEVAFNVYASGFDGYTVVNCPFVNQIWKNTFIEAMQKDSMVDLSWSTSRKSLSVVPIMVLQDGNMDDLTDGFRSKDDYLNNKKELELIRKELKKVEKMMPALVGQRRQNGEYVEEIIIVNQGLTESYFQIKLHYEKKGIVEKLIRIEYIPKAQINFNGRKFGGKTIK
jgi:hypothetical protein